MHGGHFVDRREQLGILRRQESERALGLLGARATHIGLPDGRLYEDSHRATLANHITAIVRRNDISAIATLGLNGFCGHNDHVAAHNAAVEAQRYIAETKGVHIPILALNHEHHGALRIPVESARKLAALALHQSQFGFLSESRALLPIHTVYQPLLYWETYDIILPTGI